MVLKRAYKNKLLSKNLAEDAQYIREEETHREYLSEKELSILWKTLIDNIKVKHMAFFSAFEGLFIEIFTGMSIFFIPLQATVTKEK